MFTDFKVKLDVTYRYTSFLMNVYTISSFKKSLNESNEITVRLYRFWSFDPSNDIPNESAYYLKMIQIINFNNPIYSKTDNRIISHRNNVYPRSSNVSNYLLESKYNFYAIIF